MKCLSGSASMLWCWKPSGLPAATIYAHAQGIRQRDISASVKPVRHVGSLFPMATDALSGPESSAIHGSSIARTSATVSRGRLREAFVSCCICIRLPLAAGPTLAPAVRWRAQSTISYIFAMEDEDEEDSHHYGITHGVLRRDEATKQFVKHADIKQQTDIKMLADMCLRQRSSMGRERIAQALARLEALWILHDGNDKEVKEMMEVARAAATAMFQRAKQEASGMRPKQLCMVLKAYATLAGDDRKDWSLVKCIARQGVVKMHDLEAHHIASLLKSLARIGGTPPADLIEALRQHVLVKVPRLSAQGVAAVLWSFAAMGVNPGEDALLYLEGQALSRAHEWQGHDIASIVWALARMQVCPKEQLVEEVLLRLAQGTITLRAKDTTTLVVALAVSAQRPAKRLVAVLEQHMVRNAAGTDSQGVANALWALATLECDKVSDWEVIDAMCSRGAQLVHTMSGQEISMSLWALAKMGYGGWGRDKVGAHEYEEYMQGDERHMQGYGDYMQDGGEYMKGYGDYMHGDGEYAHRMGSRRGVRAKQYGEHSVNALIQQLAARAGQDARTLQAQGVSNSLWAFATMGMRPHGHVTRQLMARARDVAEGMSSQGVSNVLWSIAKLGSRPDAALLAALCHRAVQLKHHVTEQGVINMLWAFGKMRMRPSDELLRMLKEKVLACACELNLPSILTTLWSFTRMRVHPGTEIVEALQAQARLHIEASRQ